VRKVFIAGLVLLALLGRSGVPRVLALEEVYPGKTRATKKPEESATGAQKHKFYFPPPGEGLDMQDCRKPQEVGLNHAIIEQLKGKASLWALWRHGHLVHVEGDFNQRIEVASLRKTWHALTIGAAIKQGKIPSYHQKISKWNKELAGNDAEATWWHVMTQSAGFDYPYDDYPDYKPGKIWTYSDHNPYHLCQALAKAYGKKNYYDKYSVVVAQAYFDAIGMRGWSTSTRQDGIRFHFDLEDMGRLGLLVLARGKWKGKEVIPQWFVEELETKQTYGMLVNYDGPYDGKIGLDPAIYPECPYGYMTWVNTDQDLYPGADAVWAYGAGAGGTYILWNHRNGIVFAGVAVKSGPTSNGIPHIIERNITGSNSRPRNSISSPNPNEDARAGVDSALSRVMHSRSQDMLWPGRQWPKAKPETVGLSSQKVDTYLSWLAVRASGEPFGTVVVRHGRIAIEHYGSGGASSSAWEIGSIRKAVGSTLLGIALDQGKLTLETPAHRLWPEIVSQTREEKDKSIQVKHLFNSTSGWKRPETPGTKWIYNNAAFTAGQMVLGRIYRLPDDRIAPLAQSRIADPIGASSWRCYHYPEGFTANNRNPGPKLAVDSTLQDLARFGYLWLRQGEWNGRQIIPAGYLRDATHNQAYAAGGHYGFCWFINDGQKLLPDVPEDAYFHVGNGKESRRTVLMVVPSLDLVAIVGTHAARFDITRGYTSVPVPHVNEWIGKIVECIQDTQHRRGVNGAKSKTRLAGVSPEEWPDIWNQALPAGGTDKNYFPPPESQGGWRKLDDPDDIRHLASMDPEKLESLRQWLLKSDSRDRDFAAVVVRRGYVILEIEKGLLAKTDLGRSGIASCAKAICATVLAVASEESQSGHYPKKMKFDDPAFQFIPWAHPLSDPCKSKITVGQLLNHTSGLVGEWWQNKDRFVKNHGPWEWILGHSSDWRTEKLIFDPGTDLEYSTHGLYHAALVCEDVTGMPYDQFAIKHLFKPVGIETWWFEFFEGDNKHGRHPSHALSLPAREMARIAYCMLREGRWADRQVIPKWFVAETGAPTHDIKGTKTFGRKAQSFSHGWELPARLTGGLGDGIPKDARFKPGTGGQLIAFVPSLDLAVVRMTGSSGGEYPYEDYLRRACAAVLTK